MFEAATEEVELELEDDEEDEDEDEDEGQPAGRASSAGEHTPGSAATALDNL